ncbi:MAG: cache domain-containing protein, partial [Treponema sp.]
MKKATSIQFRFLRAIIITIVSIIGFISTVVGYELYKKNGEQFDEFTAQQFFNIEKSINIFIQNGKNVVTMLASNPIVQSADETIYNYTTEAQKSGIVYTHTGKTEQALVTLFRAVEESFMEFQDVYMGTRWGGIASSWTGEDEPGYDPRQRPWYKQAVEANGNSVITPVYVATDGSPTVAVVQAVKDSNGSVLGCVGIDVNLTDLTSFISSVRTGNTG